MNKVKIDYVLSMCDNSSSGDEIPEVDVTHHLICLAYLFSLPLNNLLAIPEYSSK